MFCDSPISSNLQFLGLAFLYSRFYSQYSLLSFLWWAASFHFHFFLDLLLLTRFSLFLLSICCRLCLLLLTQKLSLWNTLQMIVCDKNKSPLDTCVDKMDKMVREAPSPQYNAEQGVFGYIAEMREELVKMNNKIEKLENNNQTVEITSPETRISMPEPSGPASKGYLNMGTRCPPQRHTTPKRGNLQTEQGSHLRRWCAIRYCGGHWALQEKQQ